MRQVPSADVLQPSSRSLWGILVTIELPTNAIAPTASKSVDRRTLLKAGAWAAPVLVLTTAAPAMAASGPVPNTQIVVLSGALTNTGTAGVFGPLSWAGGSITWSRATPGEPTTARVSYTVILTGPSGTTTLVPATSTLLTNGKALNIGAIPYGAAGLPAGKYTVTITVVSGTGSNSSSSGSSSLALVTSDATVVAAGGGKHNVTLTLTGPAGANVTIGATPTSVKLSASFPTSGVIDSNGTYSVTRTLNATGHTAGSIKFTLGGPNVVVSPSEISKPIPV